MKKRIILLFIATIYLLKAQEYPPPTDLISVPTAGTLMRGSFSMDMRIQDEGGLILGLSAGITDRFQFGMSFGSPNLIGDDSLSWYPRPEAKLKYLILDDAVNLSDFNYKKNLKFKKTCIYIGSFFEGKGVDQILRLAKKNKKISKH